MDRPNHNRRPSKRRRRKKKKSTLVNIILTVLKYLGITLGAILILIILALGIIFKGPSKAASKLLVLSMNETSALKFIPHLYLSSATVDEILNPAAPTDTFIELPIASLNTENGGVEGGDAVSANAEVIEIIDIKGPTFKGKLMLVHDPSLVMVGSIDNFGNAGMVLSALIDKYNGIGGTNAGGFVDVNGQGNGGTPDGMVIRDGKLVFGNAGSRYVDVVGFDADHKLHVGDMTGQEALNAGIVNGTSFTLGPCLIKDGQRIPNNGSGINPRTAIGQTNDGTIILIAIEGRRPDSLGATFNDMADILEQYGAINAANLDGGSSSGMYYKGERITRSSSIVGDRPLPTAIVVLGK